MIFGLILILIAAIVFIAMLFTMSDKVELAIGAFSVNTNAFVVYLIGAATLLLFMMGLESMRNAAGKKVRKRREARRTRKRNKDLERERDSAVADRDRHDHAEGDREPRRR